MEHQRDGFSGNPILRGWYADPEVAVFGDRYWIYPTFSDHYPETPPPLDPAQLTPRQKKTINPQYLRQTFIDAFSSKDLVTWEKHARVLSLRDVTWAEYALWAPAAIQANGRYYLFFSANDIQSDRELGGIGVAVADRPEGPFVDAIGKPLIDRFHNGAQPIDQFVFRDDDGTHYIYYGGWRHCNVARLAPDLLSIVPFPDGTAFREITPEHYVEGPFVFKRGGRYYLMWSEGGWTGPHYSVAYAMADTPLGPFRRIGKILQQDPQVATGAGHHSVLQVPGTDEWYIVYHRRPLGDTNGNHREVCIDALHFNEDGTLQPVNITFTGVKARPLPAATAAGNTGSARPNPRAAAKADRPNIVVLLADDMGFSDLGCYGGEIETPHLDSLARGGVRFSQFYNAARCCPSRAALLTGLYPHQAGIGHMVANDGIPSYQGYLNDRCVTLAEALKPAGYTTLMTGKWHVGSAPGQWPLDRGFDQYWGTPSGGGVYFKQTLEIRKEVFFVEGRERIEVGDDYYATQTFTDKAIEKLERHMRGGGGPFFLYLAHIAPHWPLQAKPSDIAKYAGRYDGGWDEMRARRFARQKEIGLLPAEVRLSERDERAQAWSDLSPERRRELARRMEIYAAQVDCLDQNVGRLMGALRRLGQWDNTLILFLSDNGCSAEGGPGGFSRGAPDAPLGTGRSYASAGLEWANACNTPLRRYKTTTHEGGIATPLIAHWPAGIPARGEWRRQPGHLVDLMPTLLEIAGARHPGTRNGKTLLPLEGRSLAQTLRTATTPDERTLFWEHEGNKAVRRGDWKAVGRGLGTWELYNLASDRTETTDLANRHPEIAAELAGLWQSWAERCGVWEWNTLQRHRKNKP